MDTFNILNCKLFQHSLPLFWNRFSIYLLNRWFVSNINVVVSIVQDMMGLNIHQGMRKEYCLINKAHISLKRTVYTFSVLYHISAMRDDSTHFIVQISFLFYYSVCWGYIIQAITNSQYILELHKIANFLPKFHEIKLFLIRISQVSNSM